MKILGKNSLSVFTELFLKAIFVGGFLIFIFLMPILNFFTTLNYGNLNDETFGFYLIFLRISGFLCLTIVYLIIKIFKSVNMNNPFVRQNVKYFKIISICSVGIAICYFVKIIKYNSISTMVCTMVFIIAALFSIVLSEVFLKAIHYKEENDLTI